VLGPGDVLSDRYRLDERLATGGMGEVWRATDQVLGRTVAVKVLLPALLADPGFAARFQAEARMMAALRHPGVVQVYDYGESAVAFGSVVYLVMAYVDGEPLSQRIVAASRLTVGETMSIVAQAADALDAVHAVGIVHRDVKPANLLVQPDGTVVLVDFGVAHDAAATRLTGTNMVLGTSLYMAPEQASGQPVSAPTDIYALGAVAYHCLAGHPPFGGGTALEVAVHHLHDEPPPLPDDVPAPVRTVVGRALAKEPAARYPSAAAFAAAARAAATGTTPARTAVMGTAPARTATMGTATVAEPAVPDPVTLSDVDVVPPPSVRPARSRRRLVAVAVVAVTVLLALAALVAALWFGNDVRAPSPVGPVPSATPSATPAATTPSRPGNTRSNPARQSAVPAPSPTASAGPTNPGTSPVPTRTASATTSTAGG
jgi:eukaryotic-like serine/threonine-protein kinase